MHNFILNIRQFPFATILIVLFLGACKNSQLTTRHLKEGELLLKSNTVRIHENKNLEKEELQVYIYQKPNKSIFFGTWKLKLQLDNIWYRENGDEKRPAVILDTNLIEKSKKQLEIYLKNKGYYNAVVKSEFKQTNFLKIPFLPTKKGKVYYDIHPGSALIIDSISYKIPQDQLERKFKNSLKNSKIKIHNVLEIQNLQAERERLASIFQNYGYYDFTENFVVFDIDTTTEKNKCLVTTRIKKFERNHPLHKQYFLKDIYVKIASSEEKLNAMTDTVVYNGIHFLSNGKSKFKPEPLYRSIFLKQDLPYSINDYNDSYRQLANLQMFKFIKINFNKSEEDSLNYINADILLVPSKKRSLSLEAMGTYRVDFGGNSQITYTQKNIFGKSEILEFNLGIGIERLKESLTENKIWGLNIGPKFSIKFPRFFLFPKLTQSLRKNHFPKSTLSTQYNFLRRVDYARHLSNFFLKYELNQGKYKKHEFFLPDYNITVINKDSKILNSLNDLSKAQRFKFEDHIVMGLKYAFLFNNELNPKVKHPIQFKAQFFLYGGLTALAAKWTNWEARNAEEAITLFSVRYATMMKSEIDLRKHYKITKQQKIAFRSFTGVSTPLDYGAVIPFDQLYFSGGPNGIRGWKQRTLGPGAYHDESNLSDRLGEIKLEANLEYRFPFYKFIKGAIFIDAGNIWALSPEAGENADFKFNRFYKEIAVASGTGVRADFNFFVLRLDAGWPIKAAYNTSLWQFKPEEVQFHFGIGYPF